jgi:hypothetical protein
MKKIIILIFSFCLCACAYNQKKIPFVAYKLSENKKLVRSRYEKMTPEQASGLLESFATDGIELHHQIAISASRNKEIELSMFPFCNKECGYIVRVYTPCSGVTGYYFKLSDSKSKPMFSFIKSEMVLEECCFGKRKSWLRRILHI